MTQQHPITPPPELVAMWTGFSARHHSKGSMDRFLDVANKAARWGADQELEACCEWLVDHLGMSKTTASLRAARRPKPPSLKEQALAELEILSDYAHGLGCSESAIRRALEALPE